MMGFCLLIFIAVYVYFGEVSGIRKVRISKTHEFRTVYQAFTVEEYKPLHIAFEDIQARNITCSNRDSNLLFDLSDKNINVNGTVTILEISKVTLNMNATWNCTFTHDTDVHTIYLLDVKVEKTKFEIKIGGSELDFTSDELALLEYDGSTTHSSEESEFVDLECSNDYQEGSKWLSYYTSNGTIFAETDKVIDKNPLNFRLLVRREYNNSYVVCSYLFREEVFSYRITFLVGFKVSQYDNFIVSINGTNLTPESNGVKRSNKYNYRFIYGEILTVSCMPNNIIKESDITMRILPSNFSRNVKDAELVNIKDIVKTKLIYTFVVDTLYLDAMYIECSQKDEANSFMKAVVNFYKDPYGDPAIQGLPANDVMFQYSDSPHTWVAHYRYRPNTTLPLTCATIRKGLPWFIRDKTVMKAPLNNEVSTRGIKYKTMIFTLDQKSITCEVVDRESSIRARIRVEFHKDWNLSILNNFHDKDTFQFTESQPTDSNAIIGCVLGILLVILVGIGIFCWRKKRNIGNSKNNIAVNYNRRPTVPKELSDELLNGHEYNCIEYDHSVMIANNLYSEAGQDHPPGRNNTYKQAETNYSNLDENLVDTSSPTYAEPQEYRVIKYYD